jgi:hypothetical protein
MSATRESPRQMTSAYDAALPDGQAIRLDLCHASSGCATDFDAELRRAASRSGRGVAAVEAVRDEPLREAARAAGRGEAAGAARGRVVPGAARVRVAVVSEPASHRSRRNSTFKNRLVSSRAAMTRLRSRAGCGAAGCSSATIGCSTRGAVVTGGGAAVAAALRVRAPAGCGASGSGTTSACRSRSARTGSTSASSGLSGSALGDPADPGAGIRTDYNAELGRGLLPQKGDETPRRRSIKLEMRRPHQKLPLFVLLLLVLTTGASAGGDGRRLGQVPPANDGVPTISGNPTLGETLSATNGSWTGVSLTYAYQWKRCDLSGGSCYTIRGATATMYRLVAADVGTTIRIDVTASNRNGSRTARSASTSIVAPPPPSTETVPPPAPTNASLPQVSGSAVVSATLTTSTGSWSGSPTGYSYQWQRCDSAGAGCTAITGATSNAYVVSTSDVGATLRAAVTAANGDGTTTAVSAATAVVTAPSPSPSPGIFSPATAGGMDYVDPITSGAPSPCGSHWTWLTSCYASYNQAVLQKDINFIAANHLGKFQRVWLSIDQLFGCFDATTGFCGYNPTYLANLDDALARFHSAGIQVDIVLFAQGGLNHFHFEALDGKHATMRQNYINAVSQLVARLAANPTDAATVALIDFQNEVYFQNEYALTGKVIWNGSTCSSSCLDQNVILPWIKDLYAAAKAAAPNFLYTASDTKRLMDSPNTWQPMYPVDVYDVHFYKDDPWNYASGYAAAAATFTKPWFAGEVGCATGNVSCTYDGNNSTTVAIDKWYLDNLPKYGARSVLVEDRGTAMTTSSAPSLTQVGSLIQNKNP